MERDYGIVILALGAAILWQGRHLAFGSFRNPGSGLFPSLIAGLVIVLSLRLIFFSRKREKFRAASFRPGRRSYLGRVHGFVTLRLFPGNPRLPGGELPDHHTSLLCVRVPQVRAGRSEGDLSHGPGLPLFSDPFEKQPPEGDTWALRMELFHNLLVGFNVALLPVNLLFCFLGVFLGTVVGVLPGIGPAATIAVLLPITFSLRPETAIIMLAGIFYGTQYGGSTTSILVNLPGEASSVITCLDGYQMARKGRAGPALGIAAFGSFIGGTSAVIGLMFVGPWVARFALRFGPPEYFALMCLSIVILTFLSRGSMATSLISAAIGLFVSLIGTDPMSGVHRFTYRSNTLLDGVGIVPAVMGLFGIAEVLSSLEEKGVRDIFATHLKGLLPTVKDWMESIGPILRGSIIGFCSGFFPGAERSSPPFLRMPWRSASPVIPNPSDGGRLQGWQGRRQPTMRPRRAPWSLFSRWDSLQTSLRRSSWGR